MSEDRRQSRERHHHRQRACRVHRCALHSARRPGAARVRGVRLGRPAPADDRRRELPGLSRRRDGPRDDAGVPRPGRALRRAPRHRGRRPRRAGRGRGHPQGLRGRHRVPRQVGHPRDGRRAEEAGRARRGRACGPWRLLLRHLRRRLLPRQADDRHRRRRHGHGGRALPREVREGREDRPPPSRVPRLGDHARPREGHGQHRAAHAVCRGHVRGRRRWGARHGEAEEHAGRRRSRVSISTARSSRSATSRTRRSSRARWSSTTRATSSPRASPRARRSPACSPPATSSTTPTARRSPPPAAAVRPHSTPSGTCATGRRIPRRTGRAKDAATAPRSV